MQLIAQLFVDKQDATVLFVAYEVALVPPRCVGSRGSLGC